MKIIIGTIRGASPPTPPGPAASKIRWDMYGSFTIPISTVPPPTIGNPITYRYFEIPNTQDMPAAGTPYFKIGNDTTNIISPYTGVAIGAGNTLLWVPPDGNGGSPNDPTPKPRSEGREQRSLGSDTGDWDIVTGTHWQTGILRVTRFSTPLSGTGQSRTVFNQIHGKIPSTGLPVISIVRRAQPGDSFFTVQNVIRETPASGAPSRTTDGPNIPIGALWGYECRVVNGVMTLKVAYPLPATPGTVWPYGAAPGDITTVDTFTFTNAVWGGGTNYFKAGSYLQEDKSTHNGGCEVIYHDLQWGHIF